MKHNRKNDLTGKLGHSSHFGKKATGRQLVALSMTLGLMVSTVPVMASPVVKDNGDGTYTYASSNLTVAANTVDVKSDIKNHLGSGFTDLAGYDWAKASIEAMAAKEVIKGYGNSLYGPGDKVTREQFASMAIRAFGSEKVSELAKQASEKAKTDSNYTSLEKINETYKGNWSNEVICAIQMFPALDSKWQCSKIYWEQEADRSDMALIIMTIAEQLGTEKFEIKENIQNNIGDMAYISNDSSKDSILKAYSAGLLVGVNDNGDYGPSQASTRAQAACVMHRLIDPSIRTNVVIKTPEVIPPVTDGSNIGEWAVYPVEGQVINGTTVTRDPATGILGFGNGQKGGIYLGIITKTPSGEDEKIAVGSRACDSYDNMSVMDGYEQRGEYIFWTSEFRILNNYARAKMPQAGKAYVGQKADILGNIIPEGSSETVFYECIYNPGMSNYLWEAKFN